MRSTQITEAIRLEEFIESQYGFVAGYDYLERELARLMKANKKRSFWIGDAVPQRHKAIGTFKAIFGDAIEMEKTSDTYRRARAYRECGHANWLKCCYCHKYDTPENLYVQLKRGSTTTARHYDCHREFMRQYHRQKA